MQCVNRSSNYVNLKTRPSGSSINCEGPKTADRAVYRLVKAAAEDLGVDPGVPQTGVSTDQKLERLYELMREYYDGVIFILDEIDMLEGPYQEAEYNSLIYQLSRLANSPTLMAPSRSRRSRTTPTS